MELQDSSCYCQPLLATAAPGPPPPGQPAVQCQPWAQAVKKNTKNSAYWNFPVFLFLTKQV